MTIIKPLGISAKQGTLLWEGPLELSAPLIREPLVTTALTS